MKALKWQVYNYTTRRRLLLIKYNRNLEILLSRGHFCSFHEWRLFDFGNCFLDTVFEWLCIWCDKNKNAHSQTTKILEFHYLQCWKNYKNRTFFYQICNVNKNTAHALNTVRKTTEPSGEDSRIRNDSEFAVTMTDFLSIAAISTSLLSMMVRSTWLPTITGHRQNATWYQFQVLYEHDEISRGQLIRELETFLPVRLPVRCTLQNTRLKGAL